MSNTALISQIREGMMVQGSNGRTIGKITQVFFTNEETYVGVWAQRGFGMGVDAGTTLYIPGWSIATVARRWLRQVVTLNVTAETATTWTGKPAELSGQWNPSPQEPGIGHFS